MRSYCSRLMGRTPRGGISLDGAERVKFAVDGAVGDTVAMLPPPRRLEVASVLTTTDVSPIGLAESATFKVSVSRFAVSVCRCTP